MSLTVSEVGVQPERIVCGARHHTHPLVLAHPLLKEVGLSLQRDVLHEVEGILHPEDLQRQITGQFTGSCSVLQHADLRTVNMDADKIVPAPLMYVYLHCGHVAPP